MTQEIEMRQEVRTAAENDGKQKFKSSGSVVYRLKLIKYPGYDPSRLICITDELVLQTCCYATA